ncbi:MAG: 3-methyl-2-oxobutanoate hydroxymethyltransferase [Tepidisphaeraceae bacterium]
MPDPLDKKFTLADLRSARLSRRKIPFLTCYDYSMARLMQQAGVPALLVGDSASNVILGYPSTLPISLDFLIELTAAVRRGAPNCLLVADMPFGSYQASDSQGFKNVARMVQLSGCDCVKIEVAASHARLVARLADAGVAMIAHLGLRPQTVGLSGGYQARGRTAADAMEIVKLAGQMERAGAAAILLEAVPPEVGAAVVEAVGLPVIGCGAGPACHAHVVVTHDAIGLTTGNKPRFVPQLADLSKPLVDSLKEYVRLVTDGRYPAHEHFYEMPAPEKAAFIHPKPTEI